METALTINGHGPFRGYSRRLDLFEPATLACVLDRLGIPGELRDSVLALKNHRPLDASDTVTAGDIIDLFVELCGG